MSSARPLYVICAPDATAPDATAPDATAPGRLSMRGSARTYGHARTLARKIGGGSVRVWPWESAGLHLFWEGHNVTGRLPVDAPDCPAPGEIPVGPALPLSLP